MRTGQQRRSSSTGSTQPALASSTRAMACSTPSVVSQRNVVLDACPGRRPVRPMRCRNELTVSGASACRTRSRSPTSIPSSSVEVHTMQASPARWKLSSASWRSSRDTALWWTSTSMPARRMCSATASVVDRDWQKNRLLPPPRDPRRIAGDLSEARAVDDEELPEPRLARRADHAPRPVRGALQPREDRLGVAHGRGQPDALEVMAGDAGQALDHAHQVGAPVGPGQRVDLVDDHESAGRRRAWPRPPAARGASPQGTPASSSGARRAPAGTGAGRGPACRRARRSDRSPTISV